ncbi:MAG TPA: hypothetical protein VMG34_00955 [Bacteroidota bacterium]|nr:hypothetical protein [Bacteroidota bacterium]
MHTNEPRITPKVKITAAAHDPQFEEDVTFWRDIEKSTIKSAVSARNEAASKLQTLVTWLWGITTSGTLGGVAFKLVANPSVSASISTILIALASALLVATYWLCVRAQFPIELSFVDPNTGDELKEIRERFENALSVKTRWLHVALACSALATVTVSLALVVHLLGK